MALTKCKECKTQISTKANHCPSCGAPVKKGSCLLRLLLIVAGFILLGIFMGSFFDYRERASAPKQVAKPKPTPKKKAAPTFKTFVEKDFYWDEYSTPYKNLIIKGVNRLHRENKFCKNIDSETAATSSKKGTAANPVFYVTCGSGSALRNVYFSKSDVETGAPILTEHQKRVARWGEPPTASGWDGSYRIVTQYIKQIANDPSSIDIENCSQVRPSDNGWVVSCNYRGKNGFGALVKNTNWFIIRKERVVAMKPANAYR